MRRAATVNGLMRLLRRLGCFYGRRNQEEKKKKGLKGSMYPVTSTSYSVLPIFFYISRTQHTVYKKVRNHSMFPPAASASPPPPPSAAACSSAPHCNHVVMFADKDRHHWQTYEQGELPSARAHTSCPCIAKRLPPISGQNGVGRGPSPRPRKHIWNERSKEVRYL